MAAKTQDLTCDEVEELAGAYALDALPEEETIAVTAHLDACSNPHPALRDLGEVAALLAFAVPAEAAPEDLGRRIMDAARSRKDASVPASQEASNLPGMGAGILAFPRERSRSLRLLLGVAAVLALATIGLGGWGFTQHQALTRERARSRGEMAILADITSGSELVQTQAVGALKPALIVQPPNDRPAYILLNWPRAGDGKTYQAWLVTPGQKPVSAGVFDGGPNTFETVHLTRALTGAQAFAVTVEPSGGSAQPTTQPFIIRGLPA